MIAAGYWAAAVVILGTVFIFVFRRPIEDLLGRTRRLSKEGLETYSAVQSPATPEVRDPVATFNDNFTNPLLRELEKSIREDLTRRNLTQPADATPALIRSLAANQIINGFLRINTLIFASQIDFLMFINAQSTKVPLETGKPFYEMACERFPFIRDNSTYDSWTTFIVSWQLITVDGTDCEMSLAGREYLKWRIDERMPRPAVG